MIASYVGARREPARRAARWRSAGRLPASAADAALVALDGWLGGTTVDGLARVLALTHSGAVRLTDRLEADGLVERRPGADARSRAAARHRRRDRRGAQRLQAERFAALEDVLGVLDATERATLTGLRRAAAGRHHRRRRRAGPHLPPVRRRTSAVTPTAARSRRRHPEVEHAGERGRRPASGAAAEPGGAMKVGRAGISKSMRAPAESR